MSAAERRWALGFAAFVAALTSLPYLLALLPQPHTFTGFLIGVEDGNSYIAKMLQGAVGDWLFHSPYSTQPQVGALLYLPYIVLGKLLGLGASHLAYVIAFHLFRILSIGLLCFALYAFLAEFVSSQPLRRLGTALALLGGGLGWVLLLFGRSEMFGSMPLDFYSPETFGYLAVFGLPHLVLARALLLYGLLGVLRGESARHVTMLWLAMALVHLLTAALGLVLLALYCAALWLRHVPGWQAQLRSVVWAVAGAAIPLAYNAWAYASDPYLRAWANQNLILAPHPAHYLLAYGWLLPFAYLGWRALRARPNLATLSEVWLLALPVLLYLPVGLQRRFAEGAWVLLLALTLRYLETRPAAQIRRGAWLFVLALPSTLLLWWGAMQAALHPATPAFRPADEVSIFETLRTRPDARGAIALAGYDTGNALPAWVPVRVMIGHGPETVGLEALGAEVFAFYAIEMTDNERLAFLRQHRVDYVVWGPEQVALRRWFPSSAPFMQTVAVYGLYELLRVLP
ncbi:MAG: hypothetical protein KIT08_09455 [Anaerolineales bacterium]|nr:MAG: hypothetical protein KIT08_09455 [Anaerolineales bacterium]